MKHRKEPLAAAKFVKRWNRAASLDSAAKAVGLSKRSATRRAWRLRQYGYKLLNRKVGKVTGAKKGAK